MISLVLSIVAVGLASLALILCIAWWMELCIPLPIIGGLPPRVEIPLSNVRTWEILPLAGGPATPDPVEVDRVVEWAERRARGDDDQRCPAIAYDHGAAVRCDTSDGHDGDPVHRNKERGIQWIQTISRTG